MKQLILSINEEETLRDLLNEEIEETKKCEVNENVISYINNLRYIKNKLDNNDLPNEVRLGIEIGQLKDTYKFKEIYKFITDQSKDCFYFVELKPLYDEFGYEAVNNVIMTVGKKMYEVKENE